MKIIRYTLGALLCVLGIVLTILPGSTLFILLGLMLISVDYPPARKWLASLQKSASKGARSLDKFLAKRRY